MIRLHEHQGTTLVEAVIAVGLLAGAVVSLAGLASLAVRQASLAGERSVATLLARQKIEALARDVSVIPSSAPDAWAIDTPGHVEYLDAHGNILVGRAGIFVRRWAVTPLPADANLVAMQVDVTACRSVPGASHGGDPASHARLASVRSRVAW